MKNIKIILGILLVAFFSFSCENEALDPALLNQILVTDGTCGIPTNLQTTATNNGTTINLSWTPSVGVTSWEVEYGLTQSYVQGAGTKLNSSVPTININNLFATNNYTFSVRSVCGTSFGEWSEPKNTLGVNLNCANPSALTVVRSSIDQATATINWTAPATQNSWEISYGAVGFNPSQGTIIASNTKPKAISGLATISYDFYVRAKCSPTENSNWVGPINVAAVTTQGTGIVGNYLLTSLTSSTATDINGDGVLNNNVLNETNCFNESNFKILVNNFYESTPRTVYFFDSSGVQTLACGIDPNVFGTWMLNGSNLNLVSVSSGQTQIYNFSYNSPSNSITGTIQGTLVTKNSLGVYTNVITNLTYTYTKQ